MISIGINPDLVELGPFTLSWHGLLSVVGGVLAVALSVRLASRLGVDKGQFYEVMLWSLPGGLLGSRLLHVLDYWGFYVAQPRTIFTLFEGGQAIWGAILGGIITAALYARAKGYGVGRILDLGAIGLILGQAIGRVGDIINGEHLSAPTGLPWGFLYTHPSSPSYGRPAQHPAVAYEMLWDLAIFGVLWKLKGKLQPPGSLCLLYLSLYAFGRLFISFLRKDSNFIALGLSQPQWISLLVLAVAVPWLVARVGKAMPVNLIKKEAMRNGKGNES